MAFRCTEEMDPKNGIVIWFATFFVLCSVKKKKIKNVCLIRD